MEEHVPVVPQFSRRPIQRGAEDQTAALKNLLLQMQSADATDDERQWEAVKRGLQETRRALGQRLLFPE